MIVHCLGLIDGLARATALGSSKLGLEYDLGNAVVERTRRAGILWFDRPIKVCLNLREA